MAITHAFVSALADDASDAAAGLVVSSNWNADHTIDGLVASGASVRLAIKGDDVDNADNSDLRISGEVYDANAISGRFNQVYRIGYNMSQYGPGYDSGEPSMGIQWESFYEQGGSEWLEWHQSVFRHDTEAEVRFETWAIDRSTYEISRTSMVDDWSWKLSDNTEIADLYWDGTDYLISFNSGQSTIWRFDKNNYAPIRQRNAGNTAFLNLPYFGSDDRLTCEGSVSHVGATPTSGTYANSFAVFQATSLPANGHLLAIFGPTVTGSHNAVYAQGSATGSMNFQCYNANSGTGANARFYALTLGGAGDPYTLYDVNGVTSFAVGIDNSDSDTFKISKSSSLGTNDALTIDTNLNVAIGNAALATSATDGFLYIPTCAGAPSGTPTTKTGRAPIVYDSTNNKLMVYDGGWIGVALA